MRRVHCSFIRLGANLGKTLSVFKVKHDAIDYPGALFVQNSSRQTHAGQQAFDLALTNKKLLHVLASAGGSHVDTRLGITVRFLLENLFDQKSP